MTGVSRVDLTVLGQPPAERADAARSRRTLLAAARVILAEHGVAGLSMDRLAAHAGVGVGTVYRRFSDRGGLAFALLNNEEQRFQESFISGPPPLGPGAPPVARVRAFLHAYVDRLEIEADLHALGESRDPTARYRIGAYRTSRTHLIALLRQTDMPLDPDFVAESLLALLSGGLFIHQRRERHLSTDQIKANLDQLLARVVGRPAC
jgi:AcrR family transcriptional regulator